MAGASDITGNPWTITGDTTGVLTTLPVKLKKILWNDPTTDAHQLTIVDNAGKTIYDHTCLASGAGMVFGEDFPDGQLCNGINITVHGSGSVYLYIQ